MDKTFLFPFTAPGLRIVAFDKADEGGAGGAGDDTVNAGDNNDPPAGDDTISSGDDTVQADNDNGKVGDDDAAATKAAEDPDASAELRKLRDEKAALLREVMEKKNKAKEAEEALQRYEGIDPDKVRELMEKEQKAQLEAEEAKGNFERVKQMMVEQHQADMQKLNEQISEKDEALAAARKQIDDLTVGNNFNGSEFIREKLVLSPTKARALYGGHFEMQDGQLVAYDKPAGAKDRTMLVDGSGTPLGFDAAIEKIIKADPDAKSMLKATVKPGSSSKSTPEGDKGGEKKPDDGLYGARRIVANIDDL